MKKEKIKNSGDEKEEILDDMNDEKEEILKKLSKLNHAFSEDSYDKPQKNPYENDIPKEIIKDEKIELKNVLAETPLIKPQKKLDKSPINGYKGESFTIKKNLVNEKNKENILETYEIEVDKAKANVEIKKNNKGILYNLYIQEINLPTAALLDEVRNELVTVTTIGMKEIIDPNAFNEIKKRFMQEAETILKEKVPTINQNMKEFLVGRLMQEMLGLGEIEFLINDINLEEIVILSSNKLIRFYNMNFVLLITNLKVEKEDEIINYSNIIARRVGRQINILTPLLDAHLISGDRVNSILYPISTDGNTITIRKFARDPYTIIDLISNKTISMDVAILLWLGIEYEMNILISGGTASGKTVLLNSCMPFIPPNHRIITVEDTRELMLPDFLYWCPLVTRSRNPEGKGEVSMLDLLINSLRMRPDRIVLGEIRRQEEAMVLFEAMHTGHSVYATLHADSAAETISRLINPPLNVPPNLLKTVNLNVVVFRDRKKGIRRVFQVAEFEINNNSVTTNILYRWVPEDDTIIKHNENSKFYEDILRNTGMSEKELKKDLEDKKKILSFLIENKIRNLNDLGRVMNLYYIDKEYLLENISRNDLKKIFQVNEI